MVYHCSGTCLLGEGTMQGVPWRPKCLRLRTPQQSGSAPTGAASSGSSQIDCKEEPIP